MPECCAGTSELHFPKFAVSCGSCGHAFHTITAVWLSALAHSVPRGTWEVDFGSPVRMEMRRTLRDCRFIRKCARPWCSTWNRSTTMSCYCGAWPIKRTLDEERGMWSGSCHV